MNVFQPYKKNLNSNIGKCKTENCSGTSENGKEKTYCLPPILMKNRKSTQIQAAAYKRWKTVVDM